MAELRLVRERSELVRRDAVHASLVAAMAEVQDRMMQIPARLAAAVAAETSQARVHELIEAEIYSALASIAEGGT